MWFPWGLVLVWWPAAAAGLWFLTMDMAVLPASFADWEDSSAMSWMFWPSPITVAGFSVSGASLLVLLMARPYVLDARRALIGLTADGIVITDRRRRTREVPWGEIRELRVHRWQGPTFGPMLRLIASTGTMKLPELVAEPELLRQEIVARAGLAELQKGWLRLTYRRAHSPS